MKRTGKVALTGLLCALALVAMFLTVFQATVYLLPALAGIILLPTALENGTKCGLAAYAVTGLLSLLIAPHWEAKLLFLAFFGYYPLLKLRLDRLPKRWLSFGIKLAVFNAAVIGTYAVLIQFLHLDTAEFELFGINFMWGFLAVGNGVFLVFDHALTGIIQLYWLRLHPVVARLFRYH